VANRDGAWTCIQGKGIAGGEIRGRTLELTKLTDGA
jgi:hypothetical protein